MSNNQLFQDLNIPSIDLEKQSLDALKAWCKNDRLKLEVAFKTKDYPVWHQKTEHHPHFDFKKCFYRISLW